MDDIHPCEVQKRKPVLCDADLAMPSVCFSVGDCFEDTERSPTASRVASKSRCLSVFSAKSVCFAMAGSESSNTPAKSDIFSCIRNEPSASVSVALSMPSPMPQAAHLELRRRALSSCSKSVALPLLDEDGICDSYSPTRCNAAPQVPPGTSTPEKEKSVFLHVSPDPSETELSPEDVEPRARIEPARALLPPHVISQQCVVKVPAQLRSNHGFDCLNKADSTNVPSSQGGTAGERREGQQADPFAVLALKYRERAAECVRKFQEKYHPCTGKENAAPSRGRKTSFDALDESTEKDREVRPRQRQRTEGAVEALHSRVIPLWPSVTEPIALPVVGSPKSPQEQKHELTGTKRKQRFVEWVKAKISTAQQQRSKRLTEQTETSAPPQCSFILQKMRAERAAQQTLRAAATKVPLRTEQLAQTSADNSTPLTAAIIAPLSALRKHKSQVQELSQHTRTVRL